jgi:hypothetical protein
VNLEFVVLLPEGDAELPTTGRIELSDLADRRWVLLLPAAGMAPLVTGSCRASIPA